MPSPLNGAVGERLERAVYHADFDERYDRSGEFWKLERGQVFAEPGDDSWDAFDRGDWKESLRLMEQRRPEFIAHKRRIEARGMTNRRVRIVAGLYERGEPITEFFKREIAALPPPRWEGRTLPRDYLEKTGRARPPRI